MSQTVTHARGAESTLHPITGEPPGIKEILARRAAADAPAPIAPTEQASEASAQDDEADRAARELNEWRRRGTEAESQLAEERRARQVAETAANTARQGAEDTGFTAVTTALAAAERETDALKVEMKTAGEAGDFGRVAEISSRLGQLGAETLQLQQGKAEYERARGTRLTDRPGTQPAQPEANTATERGILGRLGAPSRDAFLRTRTDASATWLRSHPEFFTDQLAFDRITGADSLAKGRSIAIDTPEYFRLIETEAGLSQPSTNKREVQPDARTIPGAGPSRDAPGPEGRRSTKPGDVYVSQEDRIAAEWIGVDPAEYAAERAELTRRGELPYRRR